MGEVVKLFPPPEPSSAAQDDTSPMGVGETPVLCSTPRLAPRADQYLGARFVLGFSAAIFFSIGWWMLGLFLLGSAIFGKRSK